MRVAFHPLEIYRRGDDYVASAKGAEHLVMDEQAREILGMLRSHTIEEVEERYNDTDIRGFIETLKTHGLVHRIGHRAVSPRHLGTLLRTPIQMPWARSPIVDGTLLGLAVIGLLFMITTPWLVPTPGWLLPELPLFAIAPLAFLAWWMVALWHEIGHYLMLARTGAPTSLDLKSQWHLMLARTDTGSARTLERSERAMVHLAGILFTAALIGLLDLLLLAGVMPQAVKFIAAIAFLDLMIQLTPLPRTDLTEAFQSATGVTRLPARAVRGLFGGECEKQAGRFMPAAIIGTVLLGVAILAYLLPWLFSIVMLAISQLMRGLGSDPLLMWEGAATLVILAVAMSLYSVSTLREHRLAEKEGFALAAIIAYLLSNLVVAGLLALAAINHLSLPIAAGVLFVVGLAYGALFLKLLERIDIERAGFAKDFLLPIAAAGTALALMVLASYAAAWTGAFEVHTMHGIAYAAGMLAALAV